MFPGTGRSLSSMAVEPSSSSKEPVFSGAGHSLSVGAAAPHDAPAPLDAPSQLMEVDSTQDTATVAVSGGAVCGGWWWRVWR